MKLDIFLGFNDIFYINKLYLTNNNPLLNQFVDDTQPPLIQEDGVEEYMVEDIMAEKKRKVGRGSKKEYEVKWRGYCKKLL